jgi:glutathione-regulated potassium-efflux system ancillary protein KefG
VPDSILILFAHPSYARSRANRALRTVAETMAQITVHDLYETYPNFLIDVEAEQDLLVNHSHIVMMHPLFWYSAPSLVKEWLDVVLDYGWAYGEGGTALAGKTWTQAITTGGPAASYCSDGLNRFSIDELMRPFQATAHLCQCVWQPPFVLHASRQASAQTLEEAAFSFRDRLEGLTHG